MFYGINSVNFDVFCVCFNHLSSFLVVLQVETGEFLILPWTKITMTMLFTFLDVFIINMICNKIYTNSNDFLGLLSIQGEPF